MAVGSGPPSESGIILPALKRLVPNLLLALASALAFVLALEGALRAFWPQAFPFLSGLIVEDPVVGTRHVPHARSRMASEGGPDVPVRINSRGYRDREYDWASPRGFRILGLGDSFAFGFGVKEEDTYLERLERMLEGRRVEVVNAGLAGMGTDNEARLLAADGPALRPDLVLVGFFVGNDLVDVLTGPQRTRLEDGLPVLPDGFVERWYRDVRPGRILPQPRARSTPGLGLPIPFKALLRRHSHAYRFLSGRVGLLRRMAEGEPAAPSAAPPFTPFHLQAFCLKRYPPEFEEAWERTRGLLREMKAWCDGHGATLAVLVIPAAAQVHPERWDATRRRYGLRDEDFDLEKPHRLMAGFAAEAGIPVIDLLPALRAARGTGGPLYFTADIHWTPRGHAVAADEILRQLSALGLLPVS